MRLQSPQAFGMSAMYTTGCKPVVASCFLLLLLSCCQQGAETVVEVYEGRTPVHSIEITCLRGGRADSTQRSCVAIKISARNGDTLYFMPVEGVLPNVLYQVGEELTHVPMTLVREQVPMRKRDQQNEAREPQLPEEGGGWSARALGFGCVAINEDRYYVHHEPVPYYWSKNAARSDRSGVFVSVEFASTASSTESSILPVGYVRKGSPYRIFVRFHEPAWECRFVRCDEVRLQFEDDTPPVVVPMQDEDRFSTSDGWYVLRDTAGPPRPKHLAMIVSEDEVQLEPGLKFKVRIDFSVKCEGEITQHTVLKDVDFKKIMLLYPVME